MNQKTLVDNQPLLYNWVEKIPLPRLKVFQQLLIIIIVMMIFFLIQGGASLYINDTMQKASLNIARLSTERFNQIITVKTYVESIEKEYIKSLAGRGNVKYLINAEEVPGLPRIQGEMIPAVVALKSVAPEESRQILFQIQHVQKLIRLPLSESNLAALKKDLNSISITIDDATNRSINASYNAITRSSNFSARMKIMTIMISVIAIALLSALYILMLSRTITEPIQKLAAYAMEIARGNFPGAELQIQSTDDLNILAVAFNKMATNIRNMITEITAKSNLERKLHEEELKNLKISKQLNEARFLALQSQINPHFLFNTLNAIMRKSMLEKAQDTTRLIQSLSDIFRYNLESSNKEVSLEEELANVREYVYIQQVRFGSRIRFEIICANELRKILIPRFIIQPLVENAITHGIEPKEEGGVVRMKAYEKQEQLIIKIIDNGVGISPAQVASIFNDVSNENDVLYGNDISTGCSFFGSYPDDHYTKGHTTGIGINNVRDRLLLYYKRRDSFSMKSKVGFGTVITLRISKNIEGEEHG